MNEEIIKKISKELNWRERIVVKLFKKIFLKTCNNLRIDIINSFLQIEKLIEKVFISIFR